MSATNGYTKLFADIVTSTIWQEPNDCRVLWITILALKGKDHICTATVPALAKMCDLTIVECEQYLQKFQDPDKYSRSQEFEGRRLKRVEGGWFVLNGPKWQDQMSKAEKNEDARDRMRRYRERQREETPATGHPIIAESPPDPMHKQAPMDIPPRLLATWGEITTLAKSSAVATKAWQAAKRLHHAPTPAQLLAVYRCACDQGVTDRPPEQWPDFRAAIRAEDMAKRGGSVQANGSSQLDEQQRARIAKEIPRAT